MAVVAQPSYVQLLLGGCVYEERDEMMKIEPQRDSWADAAAGRQMLSPTAHMRALLTRVDSATNKASSRDPLLLWLRQAALYFRMQNQ